MQVIVSSLIDGGFAAIAGLGFAYACNPPIRTLFISAFLAAIAHAFRFYLMQLDFGITSATFFSAFIVGILGLIFAKKVKCPTEIITFPAILPMIPGMYAYRTILSIVSFSQENNTESQYKLLIELTNNLITTISVALAIAVGISLSLLIFYEHSFMMTRKSFKVD
ncbi:MAG: threonine/serine exporter family protein [Helicobacteraceae bacterium]|nr:threonine/serine exporter family protein [Helicobacteraceae bacterium]